MIPQNLLIGFSIVPRQGVSLLQKVSHLVIRIGNRGQYLPSYCSIYNLYIKSTYHAS